MRPGVRISGEAAEQPPLALREPGARRLLVITTDFPPSPSVGGLRTAKVSAHLRDRGWNIAVITLARSALTPVRDPATRFQLAPITYPQAETLDSVHRVWAINPLVLGARLRSSERTAARRYAAVVDQRNGHVGPSDFRPNWRRRAAQILDPFLIPDEYLMWIWPAVRLGDRLIKDCRPNAIWASFPSGSGPVVAALLSKKTGVPLVIDFRDCWTTWSRAKHGRVRSLLDIMVEGSVLTQASAVTAVSSGIIETELERCPQFSGLVRVLPQGWDPAEAALHTGLSQESRKDGVFRLLYGGTVLPKLSDPTMLLHAVRRLLGSKVIDSDRFRVVFLGPQLVDVRKIAQSLHVSRNVETRPNVSRSEALLEFTRADVLLLIVSRRGQEWVTGKLWDYLTVGRPILALIDPSSAAAKIVLETKTGVVCDPWSESEIAERIESLWRDYIRLGTVPYRPDVRAMAALSVPAVAAELGDLLGEVALRASAGPRIKDRRV